MNPSADRLPEIDGIRGILSIVVVVGHINVALGAYAFAHMQRWYWMPMDVFFVISGFLLGRIVIANLGQPGFLKSYFIRRILRIWPAYFAVVLTVAAWCAVATALGLASPGDTWTTSGVVKQLLFVQFVEYIAYAERATYLYSLFHTWSVAVEEQFYALLPLFVFLLRGRSRLFVAGALLAAAAVAFALRYSGMHAWVLPTRLHGFALGMLLAYLTLWAPQSPRLAALLALRPALLALLAVTLLWLFASPLLPYDWISTSRADRLRWISQSAAAAAFAFTLLLAAVQTNRGGGGGIPLLRARPLTHLGEISYSTYLWHWPLLVGLRNLSLPEAAPEAVVIVVALAVVFTVANASYFFIELPFLRLKHLWAYRPVARGAPAAP